MIQLGTKADTLESFRPHFKRAKVCPSVVFTVAEWQNNPAHCLDRIQKSFGQTEVIVRSSAASEDSLFSTMAGVFDSVANVYTGSCELLSHAVEKVIASYQRSESGKAANDQVLVQPMICDISMSGVIFTHDLNSGPYYVINYDDTSGKTDTVTGGKDSNRTLVVHRSHWQSLPNNRFRALLAAAAEIEMLLPLSALDIEFAVTKKEEIYIFQVRRLAVQEHWNSPVFDQVDSAIEQVASYLSSTFQPNFGILGKRSIFGEMSDWNPAEMIGTAPRALALSLYQELITDSAWADARAAMGYRDLGKQCLMISFAGKPYIDVRKSFNSFLPAALDDRIGEALVNSWLAKLDSSPELHDKIEFEIATTAYPFDFDQWVRPTLAGKVLTESDVNTYAASLRALTNSIVSGENALLAKQHERISRMEELRTEAILRARSEPNQALAVVRQLLSDCREFGTKPFAILARCAFIAEDLLRSLERLDLLSNRRAAEFRGSVRTVLSEFLERAEAFQEGEVSEAEFFAKFGHLRPGTYNILSTRYDQRPGMLASKRVMLGKPSRPENRGNGNEFQWTPEESERIDRCLRERGFTFNSATLLEFMKTSIAGRELAKLKFTQNVSEALELIAGWGASIGLSRDEISHLSIRDILGALTTMPPASLTAHFKALSRHSAQYHEVCFAIRLPYLIRRLADVYVIPLLKSQPNFVTQKSVTATLVYLTGQEANALELEGKIILIESADPGYDWIFMSGIAGLITKYGGANSHMAIRCAELGIPAAIGCGEQIFDNCLNATEVSLDCGAKLIVPV